MNVVADQVGKVLPHGIEIYKAQDIDHSVSSYQLIVEVEDRVPSQTLVRYLSKDVPDLTLEYHTELLTYYTLPNITKSVLLKKVQFLEKNKDFLGLIDFEVVSLPSFEVVQRNIC